MQIYVNAISEQKREQKVVRLYLPVSLFNFTVKVCHICNTLENFGILTFGPVNDVSATSKSGYVVK